MAKAVPESALQQLPLDHPLYTACIPVRNVRYSGPLLAQQPDLATPTLEAVILSGQAAVIYSRYGLGTTWDGQERPYALAYESEDALRLGMNVLMYAMTH